VNVLNAPFPALAYTLRFLFVSFFFFFFFQAEDGIRDRTVTGVQTCALPICNRLWHTDASFQDPPGRYSMLSARIIPPVGADTERSEERRVGKECRSRWSP